LGALNTVPDAVCGFDPKGDLSFVNDNLKILMRELGLVVTKTTARWEILDVLKRRRSDGGTSPILDGPGEDSFEIELAPGRWAHVGEKRSRNLWSVLVISDATASKQATQTLEHALRNERETNAIYRNFVAMVSYQFRTPLSLIDSSAQRLIRMAGADTADEVASRALKIRKAIQRLTRLVESTLNARRFDVTQLKVHPRPSELTALVKNTCDRHRDSAPQRIIHCDAPRPVAVHCDPVLMEEVLNNLIGNALKYSPAGTPVEVRCWSEGHLAFCSVRDQGVGIPIDDLAHLFERFFRASTGLGVAGTGIGLHFSRHVVQRHGGTIEVETDEGKGSTFTVRLPIGSAAGKQEE
jgi:signal transduction histidine kinase